MHNFYSVCCWKLPPLLLLLLLLLLSMTWTWTTKKTKLQGLLNYWTSLMNSLLICFHLHYTAWVICLLGPVRFLSCAESALAGSGADGASGEQLQGRPRELCSPLVVNSKLCRNRSKIVIFVNLPASPQPHVKPSCNSDLKTPAEETRSVFFAKQAPYGSVLTEALLFSLCSHVKLYIMHQMQRVMKPLNAITWRRRPLASSCLCCVEMNFALMFFIKTASTETLKWNSFKHILPPRITDA